MIHTIKFVLSVLIVSFAFTSCEKEYSVENGGIGNNGGGGTSSGTSVYTWEGAPGTCATPVISGVYQAGTTLNGSNTVVLTVNVTTVGTYTVSTGTNNGISFSETGTFTITGSQILILNGSGTPAAAGTFNFIPGTNGCSFQITSTPVIIGPAAVGTLDCASATILGVYTQGIDLNSTNTVSIPVNITTAGSYNINTTSTNGCIFSGSGTLALGAQTIVLTGAGTPVSFGTISFPANFGTNSCSFSITFIPGIPPPTDYLRCKMDGVLKTFNAGIDGDNSPGLLPNSVAVSGNAAIGSGEYLDITVNSITPITIGAYLHPFGIKFSTSYYLDPSASGWQPADNSTPAFSVIVTAISATRITGTFSGQYKDQNGTGANTKLITNGEFSVTLP